MAFDVGAGGNDGGVAVVDIAVGNEIRRPFDLAVAVGVEGRGGVDDFPGCAIVGGNLDLCGLRRDRRRFSVDLDAREHCGVVGGDIDELDDDSSDGARSDKAKIIIDNVLLARVDTD